MRASLRAVGLAFLSSVSFSFLVAASGAQAQDVIATAAAAYRPLAALEGKERFPRGAELLRIRQGKAEQGNTGQGKAEQGKATPLVPGFYATADAQVSFDGQSVLFAARPTAADVWQIWEQPLSGGAPRKLYAGLTDAIRPFYLPAGQFVFALRTATGFQLEVAGKASVQLQARVEDAAGARLLELTHVPGSAIPVDVLRDGRILFESLYPLGEGTSAEMYLVYTDGSGVESYRCDHGSARWGGHQLESGDVVFTHGASLGRFTSAHAHEVPVAAPHAEYAGGIAETATGEWLLSARHGQSQHYALLAWMPSTPATAMKTVLALADRDLLEPVVVQPRQRPNHHPTALHAWNYGNQLALDVRISREGNLVQTPAQVRLETLDSHGQVLDAGTSPIESDGSFFVQTPADRAIRFVLLDAQGAVVRREQGWFWMRAGEQRICTGCHAGPERGAENRVPAVLFKTTTPVNLTGVHASSMPKAATPGEK